MQWIAPSEKTRQIKRWKSGLGGGGPASRPPRHSAQYSTPVLGRIFLRFAEARFAKRRAQLEKSTTSSRRGPSRIDDPGAYHAEGVIYLTPNARYDHLLNLPEGTNVGQAINEAMADIEKHNPQLAGVLPRTYQIFNSTLLKELLKKVSEIPESLEYDAFGRIYEYFLGEFARTEGQKGGEFFTPSSIVRLIVQTLSHIMAALDPPVAPAVCSCKARFVHEHKKNPSSELSIFGVEKTDETGRLCRMSLAVHGLEGDIRHGGEVNSYYDDPHKAVGAFDFALANPPFNVNAVDKDRLKDAVGPGRRFPFGLPRTDNGNYLDSAFLFSAERRPRRLRHGQLGVGRACVEQELRSSLSNLTPWTSWSPSARIYFTQLRYPACSGSSTAESKTPRANKVLFIDVRRIYRQIDRAHRDWTEAQIGFLASIVRLYRDEDLDFTLGGEEVGAKISDVFGSNQNLKSKIQNTKMFRVFCIRPLKIETRLVFESRSLCWSRAR
jgi:type I restriction enzyme M protein